MTLLKQHSQANSPGYMIQLDSLRALALFGVMFEHFVPESVYRSILPSWKPPYTLEWGSGITLFFVLSGFLITGILLRCRDIISSNKQSIGFTLQRFYIRRCLRIFPIYYLTIAITAILFKQVRSEFFWHLTYTTNISVFVHDSYNEYATHFWTLAMEEQFYLVWPIVILLLPKKQLSKAIFVTIFLAPLFRFIGFYYLHLSVTQTSVFPLASLDALGLGSLLALYTHNTDKFRYAKESLCRLGLWVCLPLLIVFTIVSFAFGGTVLLNTLIKPTILAVFFVWLINGAAQGFRGIFGKILELKPLVFIGKISYGIYVYHNFMNPIYGVISWHLNISNSIPLVFMVTLKAIASFAVAIPSWFLIEKPINNLKKYFNYKKISYKIN